MLNTTRYQSPLGDLLLASDGDNLVGLWLEGQKYHGGSSGAHMVENSDLSIFAHTKDWLDRYFMGEKPAIDSLPLRPKGTHFRQEVWQVLCAIPYGQTITYGQIGKKVAERLGRASMSSQAVGGGAVGHNPISIIIPCHRVIGANGSLTGYAGGIETKVKLLVHEQADLSDTFIPTTGTSL